MMKSKAINMIRNTRFIAVQLSLKRHETIRLKLGLAFGWGTGVRRNERQALTLGNTVAFFTGKDSAKADEVAFLRKKTWLAPVVR